MKLPTIILNPKRLYQVYFPSIKYYVNRIENLDYFHFIKLNECFWKQLNGDINLLNKTKLTCGDEEIIKEVTNFLKSLKPNNKTLIVSVSDIGAPQMWGKSDIALVDVIENTLPKGYIPHFAINWKIYTLENKIYQLYESFKKYHTVTIGFDHLREIKNILGLELHSHINLTHNEINSEKKRERLADKIFNFYDKEKNHVPLVFLLQAGELISAWLISKLSKKMKKSFIIDIGRAIDAIIPNRHYSKENIIFNELVGEIQDQPWLLLPPKIEIPRCFNKMF